LSPFPWRDSGTNSLASERWRLAAKFSARPSGTVISLFFRLPPCREILFLSHRARHLYFTPFLSPPSYGRSGRDILVSSPKNNEWLDSCPVFSLFEVPPLSTKERSIKGAWPPFFYGPAMKDTLPLFFFLFILMDF